MPKTPTGNTEFHSAQRFDLSYSMFIKRRSECVCYFCLFFLFLSLPPFRGRSVPAGVRGSPSRSVGSSRPQNSWRWAGGSGRQHTLLMEIQLTKVHHCVVAKYIYLKDLYVTAAGLLPQHILPILSSRCPSSTSPTLCQYQVRMGKGQWRSGWVPVASSPSPGRCSSSKSWRSETD